ncbi:piwi-like protein 1 [Nematostella vectensis]|uniref:piwi-like protein 1 n=1 Tax=Nematostella vectensis TaxID=45351 RepID=UPI0020772A2D|nr:piwi-like protein 1 [Nematostella vectensis]
MTGRARGRARGRGRSEAAQPGGADAARRPGEPQPAPGRGRSRGPPAGAVGVGPPKPQPPPQQVAPPTQQMAAMSVEPRGAEPEERRERREYGSEPTTRRDGFNKEGSVGTKVGIVSNYFRLETRPQAAIYQYNVSFSPEVDFKKARFALIGEQRELLGNIRAFDGMVLFLPKKLPDQVTKIMAVRTRRETPDEPVEITITLTNELPADSPTCLHLFNIILKRILKYIDMKQVGRNYYYIKNAIAIPKHGLELWPGYTTSILKYEHSILLGADVSHKVLRKQTVLDFLYELYNKMQGRGNFHDEAAKKLVGEIVLTRYNNKTYRVDDIDWNKRPNSTFTTPKGEISFNDYYKKNYDFTITDQEQPLLFSKPKKVPGGPKDKRKGADDPVLLLPELCFLTGLSDDMRADFSVMKDLAVHTRLDPKARSKDLNKLISEINNNPDASGELSGWGLRFGRNLLDFDGRILPGEKIFQKNKGSNYDPKSADWSREIRGAPLHSTVNLENWVIVHTNRDSGVATDFQQTLARVCGPMGINTTKPRMVPLNDDRTDSYLKALSNEIQADFPQIVVTIVPSNRKDRYDSIKKLCCLEKGVPSQVVVSRTLSKKQMLMSVCTKIGIQLNCKLGGEAWAVDIPLKNLMIVGIDTYHDSSQKGRSVGGFVASLNKPCTRYYSRCTFQHSGQELVDGLKVCMTAALRQWQQINGVLPDKIIVFRDGVGDGQLRAVIEHEVPQILSTFKQFQDGYDPKFGFTVVKKRIQTRLFMREARDPDMRNLMNPPPGTVVDKEVTRSEWFDFFIVSQSVRQGTVSPTHYNVIHDTTGLRPDHWQQLSYKLTHLYYNWPGTVRVPAPCQYAHKLAFLVGQSLHKEPSLKLADKLYFL